MEHCCKTIATLACQSTIETSLHAIFLEAIQGDHQASKFGGFFCVLWPRIVAPVQIIGLRLQRQSAHNAYLLQRLRPKCSSHNIVLMLILIKAGD